MLIAYELKHFSTCALKASPSAHFESHFLQMKASWLILSWLLVEDEVVGDDENACSSWLLIGGLACSSAAVDQLSTGFMPGARDICGDGNPVWCCSDEESGHMFGWFILMLPKPEGDLGACCWDQIPPP